MNSISTKYRELLAGIEKFFSYDTKKMLIISIIVGVLCHFYFYTNNVMAPDMVWTGFQHISNGWEASLGRWGIHFIDELRNGIVNPVLIAATCIVCVSFASVFIVKTLDIKNTVMKVLIGVLVVVAPQLAETLMFTFTADAYAIAMLLSCIGIYLVTRDKCKIWHYFVAACCIVFSLALYQAYIGLAVGLVCVLFIKKILEKDDIKSLILWFIKTMIFILVCLILYYLVTNLYLHMHGWELNSYKGANGVGIGLIFQLPTTIVNALRDYYQFLFEERVIKNQVWNRDIINIAFTLLMIGGLLHHIVSKKIYKNPFRLIVLLVALVILPIGTNVMDLITPGTSINLVTGYGLILFYVLVFAIVEDRTHLFVAPAVVAMVCLCATFVLSNNASYMAREEVFRNFYAESTRILTRVEMLEGYTSETKWMFSDNIVYRSNFSDYGNGFISNDKMTWNEPIGIWLNENYFREFLGEEISMVSYEEHNQILDSEAFKNMGVYPAEDSIQIIDGVVVIKLSEQGSYVK